VQRVSQAQKLGSTAGLAAGLAVSAAIPRPARPGSDGWAGRSADLGFQIPWPSRAIAAAPVTIALLIMQGSQLAVGTHDDRAHSLSAHVRLGDIHRRETTNCRAWSSWPPCLSSSAMSIYTWLVVKLADPLGYAYPTLEVHARCAI